MAHGHGGARRNAGRKRNADTELLRHLMDEAIGTRRWQKLLKRVIRHIETTGDASAFYRLATLRFGTPMKASEPPSDVEPLRITDMRIYTTAPPPDDDADQLPPADDDDADQLPPPDMAPDLTEPADDDDDADQLPPPSTLRSVRGHGFT